MNKKGCFHSHENIISYGIPLLGPISKIVHPSLPKDITGATQIKRDKCYSLMLLCLKINCINFKNQINKVPTIIKQDDTVLFQIFMQVFLLMSAIFFCVIIMVEF